MPVNDNNQMNQPSQMNQPQQNHQPPPRNTSAMEEAMQAAKQQYYNQNQNPQMNSNPNYNQNQGNHSHINALSLMSINQLPSHMSTAQWGENVQKIKLAIEELLKMRLKSDFVDKYKVIILDSSQSSIAPISSILITYKERDTVTIFSYLIEGSGAPFNDRIFNYNNVQLVIPQVASDVNTNYYWENLREYVKKEFNNPNLKVLNAGISVIAREFTPEDSLNMFRTVVSGVQAIKTIYDNATGVPSKEVQWVNHHQQENLFAQISYNTPTTNANGLPVHSMTATRLFASKYQNQNDLNIPFTQERDLAIIHQIYDFIPAPPQAIPQQPMYQQFAGFQPQMQGNQPFFVRSIISRIENQLDAVDLRLFLLSIAASTLATRNYAWINAFSPNYSIKGVDYNDIGGLGNALAKSLNGETRPPEKISTKTSEFGPNELFELVRTLIRPEMVYSMLIDESSDQSWITYLFLAGSNVGDPSYQLIVDTANKLTNGAFGKRWDRNQPITIDTKTRLPAGYYLDDAKNKQDIRKINQLAIYNRIEPSDSHIYTKWSEAMNNINLQSEVRTDTIVRILKEMYPNTLYIKGYQRMVNFSPAFLAVLSGSLEEAGFSIKPKDVIDHNGQMNTMIYNPMDMTFNPNMINNLYSYGNTNNIMSHQYYNPWGYR